MRRVAVTFCARTFHQQVRFIPAPKPEPKHDRAQDSPGHDRPTVENCANECATGNDGQRQWPNGVVRQLVAMVRPGIEESGGEDFAFFSTELGNYWGEMGLIPKSVSSTDGRKVQK